MRSPNLLAGSVVIALVGLGGAMALPMACSPSGNSSDASVDSPPCDPDSSDTVGCACDPTMFKPVDCYTGPPGTSGKGLCQTGKRSCNANGTQSACVGEVTPTPEICNYADDDCNGLIDDLPAITEAGTLFNCSSPACDPGYTDASITCWTADLGICGAGTKSCMGTSKGGQPTGCTGFIHGGVKEVCNGLDDDCNGIIDDGLGQEGPCVMDSGTPWNQYPDADLTSLGKQGNGTLPTVIEGECLNGNLTCTDSNCITTGPNAGRVCFDAGDTCFPSDPKAEVCNGKDDNCNGIIDEKSCTGSTYAPCCCTSGTYHACLPCNYTMYGYTCYDAGP
jgi:hypothetical protein